MPIGIPSASKPQGTFSAGNPVRLAMPVNCMMAESMSSSTPFSITTVVAPSFVAVKGSVGQTKASTLRNALMNSLRSSVR